MSGFNLWQSGTAALMTLAIATGATAPILTPTPASAQLFPQQNYPRDNYPRDNYPRDNYPRESRVTIPSGTRIPVRYDKGEKIVVSPDETVPLTVTVATDIVNRRGTVLIPAGSEIVGELQPTEGGSQFVASELVIDRGRRQEIDATSRVIKKTQEVRRGVDAGSIAKGAVLGSAAAAVISGVTGNRNISAGEVLLGTGAGAAGGALLGRKKANVIVINPDTDLDLTLGSSLSLGY